MKLSKFEKIISIIVGLIAIYNFIFLPLQSQPTVITPSQPVVITSMSQPTPTATLQYLLPRDLLSIDGLKSRQKLYRLGDNATVDFIVNDERKLSYNFTVSWIHNDTLYYGWSNESNYTKPFWSWSAPIDKKGTWKVQVVLKWVFQNETYKKDEITEFDVS